MPPTDPRLDPEWIRRFRAARTPEELAKLFLPGRLKKSDLESRDHTLRTYMGEPRYKQLAARAARHAQRRRAQTRGNVVVLPGVMGSELSLGPENDQWKLWVTYWYIYRGYLA